MKEDCECADGWEKYYIYFQSIAAFLVVLSSTVLAGFIGYTKLPVGRMGQDLVEKVSTSVIKRVAKATKRK